MFCIYLRKESDLCHLQKKLIGFYNRDEKCLQRGTDWVFKYSSLLFVFKGLNSWLFLGKKHYFNIEYKIFPILATTLVQTLIEMSYGGRFIIYVSCTSIPND